MNKYQKVKSRKIKKYAKTHMISYKKAKKTYNHDSANINILKGLFSSKMINLVQKANKLGIKIPYRRISRTHNITEILEIKIWERELTNRIKERKVK